MTYVGRSVALASILVTACSGAKATSDVSGTWTGSLTSPGALAVGIRFILAEQNGQLTGQAYVEDPSTHEFLVDAGLTGSRQGSDASWTTTTDLVVRGAFEDNAFIGTVTFPAEDVQDLGGHSTANLSLRR